MAEGVALAEMALAEQVARAVLVVVVAVVTFMSTMRGIHQTLVEYRILMISLVVLRSMGRENLLMDMEGIRILGAIELSQEMACMFMSLP